MLKLLRNEEEKEDESHKRKFYYWQYLFIELKRVCIGFLNLQDLLSFDSSYSNRKELKVLLLYFRSHITNNYEFKSLESLLWASKKLPKLAKPRLVLHHIHKRLTTWHYVCQSRGLEHVMSLLIQNIVDSKNIDQKDAFEMTGLHYACREGLLQNVKLLVDNKAAINIQDVYGRTPVFIACLRQHDEVFEFLAHKMKADLTIASYGGQSIADLIEERASSSTNAPSHWETIPVAVLTAVFFFFYYKRGWELFQELFRK
jgi:hypothetical protein